MIAGIGIDIIEVKRIQEVIERHGERFLKRIFTEGEIQYCSARKAAALHYAGRFASKEAAFKAMGQGWTGNISWKDVEIHNEPSGKPLISFHGNALELIRKKNVVRAYVSISHIQELATAVVVIETDESS